MQTDQQKKIEAIRNAADGEIRKVMRSLQEKEEELEGLKREMRTLNNRNLILEVNFAVLNEVKGH